MGTPRATRSWRRGYRRPGLDGTGQHNHVLGDGRHLSLGYGNTDQHGRSAAFRGTIDTNTANNRATDTTELTPQVDIQITKSDGRDSAVPGFSRLTYTIVVTNAGPSAVSGATITNDLPNTLMNVRYVSSYTGTASGNTAVGEGNIFDLLNLGPGDSVEYQVTADVRPSATGSLVNTARIRLPQGVVDTALGNNSATDIDVVTPQGDLSVKLSDDKFRVAGGYGRLHSRRDEHRSERRARSFAKGNLSLGLTNVRYISSVTSGVAAGNSGNESGQSRESTTCRIWPHRRP